MLKDLNLETKIKNRVHELLDKNGYFRDTSKVASQKFKACKNLNQLPEYFFEPEHEPLDNLQTARKSWSEYLKTRLNNFARQSRKPWYRQKRDKKVLAPSRTVQLEEETSSQINDDVSISSAAISALKDPKESNQFVIGGGPPQANIDTSSIFDHKVFLEHILKVTSMNYAGNQAMSWGQVKSQIQTKSLDELRRKFIELNVTLRQIGVDEEKSFIDERILIGERLLTKDYQPFLVQYAKRGVPPSLRNRIYKRILYADVSQKEIDYFSQTQEQASKWESVLDDLILTDILEACNDDRYFIFEDMLETVTMFFFRDRQVFDQLKSHPHAPVLTLGSGDKPMGVFPQCGILPFKNFALTVAPFCYVSDSKEEVYFIFRAFYCKYFCYLTSISSHPQSMISLCKLFEDLLQTYEPEVCYHLNQLQIQPLRTAFNWMFSCFIEELEISEVFLIFDRILGFESLEILPIIAAGIFVFRANLILNCSSQEEFDELFVDLTQIKVVPIIQHFLFATGVN